jgi:hypothetical protein
MGSNAEMRQSYPSPETKSARCFGPKKATVVVPSGHGPIVRSPCNGGLGAQYAGIFSATSAYVEKVRTQFLSLRHPVSRKLEMVAVVRFQNRMPLPCAASSSALANNSATEARIHRNRQSSIVERLEQSLLYQTIAIFRLVKIFCLVEANWSDQLR